MARITRHGHGWARARAARARLLVRRQGTTKGLNGGDLGSACWWRIAREARGGDNGMKMNGSHSPSFYKSVG